MNYMDALRQIHATIAPEFYVEIGCLAGASLEMADCPRLGIDPKPQITTAQTRPTRIYRQTSDTFFARADAAEILGRPFDMAFIDGMHLAEFALRDFINLERHAARDAVIVIDDVVPGDLLWAARERETQAWTGDVYRIIPILRQYRPDLEIRVFDAKILEYGKGLAIISNLDPENETLSAAYPGIEAELTRGGWRANSVEALRDMLDVAPAEAFSPYLETLFVRRAPSATAPDITQRYLDLVKSSLLNEIYLEDEFRQLHLRECLQGNARHDPAVFLDPRAADPERYAEFEAARHEGRPFESDLGNLGFAQSMMGRLRMENLHHCLDHVRGKAIAGDVMECGVWRGGGCIFMAAYLAAHRMTGRHVLVADSFQGLPKPTHPRDSDLDLSRDRFPQLAIPRETVARNFRSYGLLSDDIVFLEGWFRDTLETAPVDRLALLRLDGDLYESTMDVLTALYDRVEPGGAVIVDDFNAIGACRKAVVDFFEARGEEMPEVMPIDWTGVWFLKPEEG